MAGATGKYDTGTVRVIIEALELGMTAREAQRLAHIGEATYYEWLQRHPEFAEAVKSARDVGKREALLAIREAAKNPKTWQAAAWYLERTWPDEYALRTRIRIESDEREMVQQRLREIAERLGVALTDEEQAATLDGVEYQLIEGSK